jgi:hypothetical protein
MTGTQTLWGRNIEYGVHQVTERGVCDFEVPEQVVMLLGVLDAMIVRGWNACLARFATRRR